MTEWGPGGRAPGDAGVVVAVSAQLGSQRPLRTFVLPLKCVTRIGRLAGSLSGVNNGRPSDEMTMNRSGMWP